MRGAEAPSRENPQVLAEPQGLCAAAAAVSAHIHPSGRHAPVMADLLETWLAPSSLACPWIRCLTAKDDLQIGLPVDLPRQYAGNSEG